MQQMGEIQKLHRDIPKGLPSTKFIATEAMDSRNFNPIHKLMDLDKIVEDHLLIELQEGHLDMDKVSFLQKNRKDLAQYYTPQVRSIDVTIKQEQTQNINVVVTRFDGLLAKKKALKAPDTEIIDATIEQEAALMEIESNE